MTVSAAAKAFFGLLAGVAAGHELFKQASGARPELRPPGALSESDFNAACIRCGKCGLACPYRVIHFPEGTPALTPAQGACQLCTDFPCVAACPSGALAAVGDKRQVRIGLAQLDEDRCVALKGMRCEVCYRSCPLIDEAIHISTSLRPGDNRHAIFEVIVDTRSCVGCGICEQRCIVQEPAAIRIVPESWAYRPTNEAPLLNNPNLAP